MKVSKGTFMEFWMVILIVAVGFIYIAEKLTTIEKKNDARLKRIEDRLQLITKEMGIIEREPEINKELRQQQLRYHQLSMFFTAPCVYLHKRR